MDDMRSWSFFSWRPRTSEAQIIVARLIAGIIIPLVVVGFSSIYYGKNTLTNFAMQSAQAITTLKGGMITNWFRELRQNAEGLARNETLVYLTENLIASKDSPEDLETGRGYIEDFLHDRIAGEYSTAHAITIFSTEGGTLISHVPKEHHYDDANMASLVADARMGTVIRGHQDPVARQLEVYIATPIWNLNGAIIAILVVNVDTDTLESVVTDRSGLGVEGESFVIDSTGGIIAPQELLSGKSDVHVPPTEWRTEIARMAKSNPHASTMNDEDHDGVVVVSYTTLPAGWILVTEIPTEELLGFIDWSFLTTLLVLLSLFALLLAMVNLRTLVEPIRRAIDQIAQAGTSLSATSQQVAASAQSTAAIAEQVAQGAVTQSTQAEAVSRSIAEIASSTQEMLASSEEAARVAREVSNVTQMAGERGEQSQQSLDQIKKMTTDTAIIARTMGNRSREIRTIVDTITRIAEQTNLLSLNAAIEAARAGDAGRGFSVVADEIRKLAEQSGNAAEEIKQQVEKMLIQINDTVLAAEKGLEHADENAKVVGEALGELQNISASIQTLSARIKDISQHTGGQLDLVQKVAGNMDSIASVAEQNAMGAEQLSASTQQQSAANQQVAAAAQQLHALALELKYFAGSSSSGHESAQRLDDRERKPIPAYILEKKQEHPTTPHEGGGASLEK